MASSNRHWPSMFKSKPTHHQWQHDINSSLISNPCQKSPYSSSGCEERSPEPKPRWNPRPEQIRILEAIFNSGMVNPPRDEIRKIRAQLQEYGQVGDANVFYWFQNRKSRSKHKQQRHLLQNNKSPMMINSNFTPTTTTAASNSSSSSPNSMDKILSLGSTKNMLDASNNSPTTSVNQQQQPYFHQSHNDFLSVPFFFPVQQQQQEVPSSAAAYNTTQGFSFPEVSHVTDNSIETCSGFLLSDLLLMNHGSLKKAEDIEKMKLQPQLTYTSPPPPPPPPPPTTFSPTISTIDSHIQGGGVGEMGGVGPTKSTVFINDVAFEVTMAPFNVRETFGEDAVLIHSSGQPVLTNDWGFTLHPLQHGSFYYLIRTLPPSSTH